MSSNLVMISLHATCSIVPTGLGHNHTHPTNTNVALDGTLALGGNPLVIGSTFDSTQVYAQVTDRKISSDMNRLMERRKPAAGKEAAG